MTHSNAQPKTLFACQCCGYLVHEARPTGSTWQVCPICAWSDASWRPEDWNSVSLAEARRNFEEFGASERAFLQVVRPVEPTDGRDPQGFQSRESLLALRVEILRAFADVERCNGTSLQEAEWNDDYCYGLVREAKPLVRLFTLQQYDALLQTMRAIEWWDVSATADAGEVLEKWTHLRAEVGAEIKTAQPPPRRE